MLPSDPAAAASACAGRSNPEPNPAPAFYDPYAPLDPHAPGSLPIRPFCKGRAPRRPRAPKLAPDDAAPAPGAVPALPASASALTFPEFECAPAARAFAACVGSGYREPFGRRNVRHCRQRSVNAVHAD